MSQKNTDFSTQKNMKSGPVRRPRRLRRSVAIRNSIAETQLLPAHLVQPLFVMEGNNKKEEIKTLPDLHRWTLDLLMGEIESLLKLGVHQVALFPQISASLKTPLAAEAHNAQGLIPKGILQIKKNFGDDVVVISDVALDPYSSDGHDGIVKQGQVVNDLSVEMLVKMAIIHAQAGADFVAPSDMMDGRVKAIRLALDHQGFTNTGIIAYTAKYASAFYGPFRDALDSAPKAGDKKTYQMDVRNAREAIIEAHLDVREGADILMVKPGLAYLDIVSRLHRKFHIPIAAYNVSGEYAMVKFASRAGALNEEAAVDEMLMSFRRAGASLIFTYFARQWATAFKLRKTARDD